MQSKGCLQGNKPTFIATSVLLLFCLKTLLVWQSSSRMEAELPHGWEYFWPQGIVSLCPWPKFTSMCSPKWIFGQSGLIWFKEQVGNGLWDQRGKVGQGRGGHGGDPTVPHMEFFSHHTHQDWMVSRDKMIPTSLNPSLYHPFSLYTFSSGGNWML